jgi:hypothetical protein
MSFIQKLDPDPHLSDADPQPCSIHWLVDHEIRTQTDFFLLIRIQFLAVYYSTFFRDLKSLFGVFDLFPNHCILCCVVTLFFSVY